METNLHFTLTLVTGAKVTQDMKCPADMVDTAVNQVLAQYSQIGMLKKDAGKYSLITASQISFVECDTSSSLVVEALPGDVAKVATAAKGLQRIK